MTCSPKRPYSLKFSANGAFALSLQGAPVSGRIVGLYASHYVANLDLSALTRSQREKALIDVPPGVMVPCCLDFTTDADFPVIRGEVSGIVPGSPSTLSLIMECP